MVLASSSRKIRYASCFGAVLFGRSKEMTHDLEMNFNKIAPFGKEDTAKELQDHAAKTQDLCNQRLHHGNGGI
eukprot:5223929-Amphidinium_carterae.1